MPKNDGEYKKMGYEKKIYEEASKIIQDRRNQALKQSEIRKERFFRKYPQAKELEKQLSYTMTKLIRIMLTNKSDLQTSMQNLKRENLAIQRQQSQLYERAGISEKDLEPHFVCEKCKDKGSIDGKVCECYKQLVKEIAYNQLNQLSPLKLSTFETFSLQYYRDDVEAEDGLTEYGQMKLYFDKCKAYAKDFQPTNARSIIMRGSTGLGKTHLSLAIASEVIKKGFGVIYCSAPDILSKLEREQFGRNYQQSEETIEDTLKECDLLILDDIGSEFSTTFTKNKIYNLINFRLSCNRPTIISTNLTFQELEQTYSQRLISRVIGEYMAFNFVGRDVREMKRAKKLNK